MSLDDLETGRPMRCFLGLALPPPIHDGLATVCAAWREAGLKGSWVPRDNYHVTVSFLGDISGAQVEQLDAVLPAAFARCAPLRWRVHGAGVFPQLRRPRVVWAGLDRLEGQWESIVAAAAEGARTIELPAAPTEAHPHITLLRLRSRPPAPLLQRCLDRCEIDGPDDFWAGSVALWESKLRPGGAIYRKLKEYHLA